MTLQDLNTRFGAPSRIAFRLGFAGYPEVVLACKYGTAEVALLGANVLSYRPTGHSPVLFRPARRDYNRGEKFHGGIPVCWPMFGNRMSKELPQHGFASKMPFEVRSSEYSEEMTEITLALKSDDATRSVWPHDFDLEVKVSVSMKLNLKMTTKNTGAEPFEFSCGFHPYLALKERDAAYVRGLDALSYFDGVKGVAGCRQSGDLRLDEAVDHIFELPQVPRNEAALIDPGLGRAIAMVASGGTRTVVWNPGEGHTIADLAADDWRRFVCVEPVSDWPGGRVLEPGGEYTLSAAIQSVQQECKNEGADLQ